ncbi:alpha/beta fold hydrolase [Sporosarcina sp. FSL K6-2383]|uniref:alpha/beta hydrolase n=1 Tax=Sporosarcina sp. FSL K6-2383 TaxID=2921556 RepID=UPI003159A0E7
MKTGVLFIHGFTGGSFEVRPFVNYLNSKTDWQMSIPILPGHDVTLELGKVSAESWLMEAELALKKLQKEVDRVIVVGFSMGGLIALYLALRYKIDKLVLLSTAAKYISPRNLLEDVGVMLAESVTKRYPPNTFYHLYEYKFRHTPLRAIIEFLRIVKTVEPYYGRITTPVCIVQGKKDGIVPLASAQYLIKKLGSEKKEFIISDLGKHHICYSDDCDNWFGEVLAFMRQDE